MMIGSDDFLQRWCGGQYQMVLPATTEYPVPITVCGPIKGIEFFADGVKIVGDWQAGRTGDSPVWQRRPTALAEVVYLPLSNLNVLEGGRLQLVTPYGPVILKSSSDPDLLDPRLIRS